MKETHEFTLSDEQVRLLRRMAGGAGFLLGMVTLLADPIGLSAEGYSGGQRLLLLVGLVLIAAGILGKRIKKVYQSAAILLLNTLILLICIEIASGFVSKIISDEDAQAEIANLQSLDHPQYANREWAERYWSESLQQQIEYAPYVVWKSAPFDGETITINAMGLRETPGAECQTSAPYRVFMFGGSTMWGHGSPDDGTIPAYVQAALGDELEQPVCVTNFGNTAYVSTQAFLQLIFELRAGNIPDAVIFYDGINDVYAAYQSGETTHQNQPRIIELLYPDEQDDPFLERLREELIDKTYAFNLANRWVNSTEDEVSPAELVSYKTMEVDTQELAAEVAAVYAGNYDFVHQMGESYGFELYFFWQPALILQPEPLSNYEQQLLEELDPARVELYRATDVFVSEAASERERLYDISEVFRSQDFWIDDMHVVPEGNQLVAEAMLAVFQVRE